jgi:hypothetical protein
VDGVPTTVPIVGDDKNIDHITSTGLVLGSGYVGESQVYTVFQDGKADRLKGVQPTVNDMNDLGVIVGSSGGRPAIWRTPTGEPEPLSGPASLPAGWVPTAIDDDGTILVNTQVTAATELEGKAYVWRPDGSVRQLLPGTMPDGAAGDVVQANSIRNGWVSGGILRYFGKAALNGRRTGFAFAGIRWNLRTGEVAVSEARGEAINALGWQAAEHRGQGVLFTPAQTVLLPHIDGVADDPAGPAVWAPQIFALSDDGRTVVGLQSFAVNGDDPVVAVAWRCS